MEHKELYIMNEERITYFGQTDARNKKVTFGIKAKDRTKHVYIIGKTGMGKSTVLENMAVQDIKNGEGFAFIDPHGKTAELLLEYVPEHRQRDVVYFAPFDVDYPISFNVLESVEPDKRHLVVSGLMSTFKKIWQDAWSARMEYILTNTLLALLEYPDATLLGVNRMLSDKQFRNQVLTHVTDPSVKSFWVQEFANYTERMAAEAIPAIQNKIGQFTANALIRNMIGQPKSSFDLRKMMDEGKIFIVNLSKGRVGESNANLLGGMIITKIYLAALSRADIPDRVLKTLPNFYLYVDEFQSFANESFADILSEARKYKLNLTMAHQYIEQMEEEVRAAVFGNVGTMIVFRVGAYDAEVLEKEFMPQFTAEDIVNLGIFQIYLKLMIDGVSSSPFSATTLPPIAKPESSSIEKVIEMSRSQFANRREDVEKNIADWHAPIKPPPKGNKEGAQGQGQPSSTIHAPIKNPEQVVVQSKSQVPQQSQEASKDAPPKVQQTPKSQPAPTTVQPFKKAFEEIVIEKPKVVEPIQRPTQQTQQSSHQPTVQLVQQPIQQPEKQITQQPSQIKPVSLNLLINRSTQKEASPQRINDLKNVLASVLGAHKVEKKVESRVEEKVVEKKVEEKKPEDKKEEIIKEVIPEKKSEPIRMTEIKNEQKTEMVNQIREIPEERLKDVLKVD